MPPLTLSGWNNRLDWRNDSAGVAARIFRKALVNGLRWINGARSLPFHSFTVGRWLASRFLIVIADSPPPPGPFKIYASN